MAKAIFLFFVVIAVSSFSTAGFSWPEEHIVDLKAGAVDAACEQMFSGGFDPMYPPEDDGKGRMSHDHSRSAGDQMGGYTHEGHGAFATGAAREQAVEETDHFVGTADHDGHGTFARGSHRRPGDVRSSTEPEPEAKPQPQEDQDDFEGRRSGYPTIRAGGRLPLIP